jgi:citrate lyase subunit beta/citryl-CoA lyase
MSTEPQKIVHDYSLLRSWLFVPGDSQRKLHKCWSSGADALIVDLEDAVVAANKEAARAIAREAITGAQRGRTLVAIRVNALDTGLTFDDLDATLACAPNCIVLPKVMAPEDIRVVSTRIGALETRHHLAPGSVRILAIATEHPRAVLQLDSLCNADPRTAAIMWGSEDLGAAIGARRVKDEQGRMLPVFAMVRSLALLAASAAGLASLDTPVVEIDALDVVTRESTEAAEMGFTGKVAIHPSQVEPINRAFLPAPAELEQARALLQAHSVASDGAFRFRGKMIDMPHVRIARRLVALAEAHGEPGG